MIDDVDKILRGRTLVWVPEPKEGKRPAWASRYFWRRQMLVLGPEEWPSDTFKQCACYGRREMRDRFQFICDSCGEVFTPPKLGRGSASRDWSESWQEAKAEGWRATKDGNVWQHRCPDC